MIHSFLVLGSSKTLSVYWGELESTRQISCNLGDKMICYNFRYKALGIYPLKGEKNNMSSSVLQTFYCFVLILTIKLKKTNKKTKRYSLGIHVMVLELELNYHHYVEEEGKLRKCDFPHHTTGQCQSQVQTTRFLSSHCLCTDQHGPSLT